MAQIEFFDELKQRLQDVQAADAAARQAGEADIRRMRDENVTKLIATLVKEIADEASTDGVRQMACIICKNLVAVNQTDQRYVDLWLKLEPVFKNNVKEAIMAGLATESSIVRNQIASLISTIAQIEIPRGEWTELLTNLCTNASHENTQIRLTSLTTIGYICEELSPDDLTQDLKNQIMLALTNNISKDDANMEACRLAIKALLYSVPYTTANFQVKEERDFIMNKILEEAVKSSNVQIRETAMQCLVEIGRQEYNSMGGYIEWISQVTSHVAKNDSSEVGSQGIEFWTTIAEVELARIEKQGQVHNFVATYKDFLIQLLLECISNVQIDDEDDAEEEWGVNLASGCCLVKVSLLLKDAVLGSVISFVQENIMHAEWQKRYAALMALGAASDGPEKQAFAAILNPSMNQLLAMFKDTSIKVREAISWVVFQICQHHSDVLAQTPEQMAMFVQVLILSLADKPKVSVYLCQAIEKLAESLAPYSPDQTENQLTPHFEGIAEALFKNAARVSEDDANNGLVQASYATLTSLCQASCTNSDASLQQMLQVILQQLQMTINAPNQGHAKIMDVQFVLCGLVQVIMVRVGEKVDTQTAEQIVGMIIQSFQQHQRVTEAGLIAYQGICTGLKERLPIREFGQYIYNALEQTDDEDVTRVAIGLVIDIADGLREQVAQYLSSLVPHMLNVLRNEKRKQDTKLAAIQSLASVSCYASQSFCQFYLVDYLTLLQQAAEVSTKDSEFQNDPDTLEYLKELRASLIEAYSQITLGVQDSNTQVQFLPYIPKLFEFLYQATFLEKTQTNFRAVAGLLGDLAGAMKGQVASCFQAQWIREMLEHLKSAAGDNESKEMASWAWDQIQQACHEAQGTPTMHTAM